MNGKQMLETILGIQERYQVHGDKESLQIELLDIVPTLQNPGIAGMGEKYHQALDVYMSLRANFPHGTRGIPEIYSNRI